MDWTDLLTVSLCILMFSICLIGIVGNFISISVFFTKSFRVRSINILLGALSVADLCMLTLAIPVICLPLVLGYFGPGVMRVYVFSTLYLYPLTKICQCTSVWLLIAITIERWIAVKFPFSVLIYCTPKRAKVAVFIMVLISVLFNFIRFYEYRASESGLQAELRNNSQYLLWYVNVSGMAFQYVLPLLFLVPFNLMIAREMSRARRNRNKMSSSEIRERSTATMLLYVVIVFMFCYGISAVLNVWEMFDQSLFTSQLGYLINDINNLLHLVNAASTWLFYLYCLSKYREAVYHIYCCIAPPHEVSECDIQRTALLSVCETKRQRPTSVRSQCTTSLTVEGWDINRKRSSSLGISSYGISSL